MKPDLNESPAMPRLSIIMPVFNRPDLLKVMVDSILASTFTDWELLAVDDGSEAETLELLQAYALADRRIRFIPRNRLPKGAQTCRNLGLEQAGGELVAFFDSDDYVAPYCLEQRVREMDTHPDLDFMVFPSGVYGEQGFCATDFPHVFGYPVFADDLAAFALRTLPFVVWNNLYRRSALLRCGLHWDEELKSLQDADFNVSCLQHGLRYAYAPVPPDYGYRDQVDGSVTRRSKSEAHFLNMLYAQEKFYLTFPPGYRNSLFFGVLNLLKRMFPDGPEELKARNLADMVCRHDKPRGMLLHGMLRICACLGKCVGSRRAMRWTLMPFLVVSYIQSHRLSLRRQRLFGQYASPGKELDSLTHNTEL